MREMPCMECPCISCSKAYHEKKCGNCIGCNGLGFHQIDTFCKKYISDIQGIKGISKTGKTLVKVK